MPTPPKRVPTALAAALLLAACGDRQPAPGNGSAESAQANAGAPAGNAAAPAPAQKAPPHTGPWSPTGYALVGTEPFWGGALTATTVRYMIPEDQFGDLVETVPTYGADSETYRGTYRERPFVLTIVRRPCSDGRAVRTYEYTVSLQVGGETRRGCADPQ